jgi:glycosyltransferase involved in cell wall biosynthesis
VIIAVRNEQENIIPLLKDLARQSYPPHLTEVLVVDDYSEDATAALVQDFIPQAPYTLRYCSLAGQSGKKAAVTMGVGAATGELLAFTDGDCRVQPDWLAYLTYGYTSSRAKFISGPVSFAPTATYFAQLQLVEFAGLIGIGGSSIALGKPNMCNGANIAYPKTLFAEVAGFAGNEHVASGDDEFLLHKAHQLYPHAICFIKAPGATVYTTAKHNLTDFFTQRVRWASKWPSYRAQRVKLLALLVFGVNFLLLLAAALTLIGNMSLAFIIIALLVKMGVDLLFLAPVLAFFRKTNLLFWALPLQIINIPYVVITALRGMRGSYRWKGRIIRNKPKQQPQTK